MRWELHYLRVYPTIFSCVDLRSELSRFFTGISRRKYGELISPMGNQRVGIFPPKSEIVFVLSLALIWFRNFQDRTIPVGDVNKLWTVNKLLAERKKKNKNKEISRSPFRAMCFRSNISETVRDNRVLFSLSSIAMIALPDGTYVVFIVVIVSEI